MREWQDDNPEAAQAIRDHFKENNPTYFLEASRKYLATPIGRLLNRLRTRVHGLSKIELGCTHEEFLTHMESQFQDGMSWANIEEWEIDHIRELWTFGDKSLGFHFTNLQPIWRDDNRAKHDRLRRLAGSQA